MTKRYSFHKNFKYWRNVGPKNCVNEEDVILVSKWKWPFPHSRFGHFQCPKRKSKTSSEYKRTPNFHLLKWPFPHSRFGHFQCPKRKSKTTSEYKHTLIRGKYGLRNHSTLSTNDFDLLESNSIYIFLCTKIKKLINSTREPPPLHGKCHFKFPFFNTSPTLPSKANRA